MPRRNQQPLNWQDFAKAVVNRASAYIGGRLLTDVSTTAGDYLYSGAKYGARQAQRFLQQAYQGPQNPTGPYRGPTINLRTGEHIPYQGLPTPRNYTNTTRFNPAAKRTSQDFYTHLRRGKKFAYKPTPRPLSGFAYKPTPRPMSNYTTIGRYSSRPMSYRTLGKRRFVSTGRRSLNRMRGTTVGQDDVYTKMKTSIGYLFNTAANTETAIINANGLFDPDNTGGDYMNNGAAQPLGFDQFAAFYSHYQVVASKIKFTCWPPETTNKYIVMYAYPSDNASVVTACAHALDKQWVKSKALNHNHTQAGDGGPPKTITMYAKTTKILAQPIKGDMTTCGSSAANPANLWYWKIGIGQTNNGTINPAVHGMCTVTFYVRWFANKQLAQSTGA